MQKECLYEGEDIKRFIPQREPIVMVDRLYEADDSHAETGLTLAPDNIFMQGGRFTEPGLIEHEAQSASVLAGYKAVKRGEPAPVGYIGEIKKCVIARLPKAGESLVTEIDIVSEVGDISLARAVTRVGGETVCECQMKIFITNE